MSNNRIAGNIVRHALKEIGRNPDAFTGTNAHSHYVSSRWSFTFDSGGIDLSNETAIPAVGEQCWEQMRALLKSAFLRKGLYAMDEAGSWRDWHLDPIKRHSERVEIGEAHFFTEHDDIGWRDGSIYFYVFKDQAWSNAYLLTI